MKIIYTCEKCGRTYAKEAEASACEEYHAKEAKQKELDSQREAKLLDTINAAVNLYVSRHHKMPEVTLTKDNEELVLSNAEKLMAKFFALL